MSVIDTLTGAELFTISISTLAVSFAWRAGWGAARIVCGWFGEKSK